MSSPSIFHIVRPTFRKYSRRGMISFDSRMTNYMPAKRNLSRSNSHFKKASKRLPLGVSSSFRYWGDDKTIFVARGKGGRVWDIDDNEYIDYRLGYGPAILGYQDDRVDEAAR